MRKMSLVAFSLIIETCAPMASDAKGSCASKIILYSWNSADMGLSSLYTSGVQCLADPDQRAGDGHVIHPAADTVAVGYSSQSITAPSLTGYLNGLGFTSRKVTLSRRPGTVPGTHFYLSDRVLLPNGVTSSGCVKVEIRKPSNLTQRLDYNEFHTVDSSC